MDTMLTDLDTQLAAPDGAALRDTLLTRAHRLEQSLRTPMLNGLSRQDFPLWQAAADAAAAAQEVLAAWPVNTASSSLSPAARLPLPTSR
ncbi:hypothetical protein [Castellaniella sp.]|uniref:hypothetical protein n=1 Tax=Castellaniella sp. TaxID=1955812 RepID=UPI002AFF825F|nr:hypothetical protein [Castellaniella sp.]